MPKTVPFDLEIANEICRRLAGGERLRVMCNEVGMPSAHTVQIWRRDNDAFHAAYAKAREFQAETIFDEMLEIADTPLIGRRESDGPRGKTIHTEDLIEHRALQIRTRQWILPRLSKNMAEKSQIDHTSSDSSMSPMTPQQQLIAVNKLHDTARKRVAAQKQAKLIVGFEGDDGSDLV